MTPCILVEISQTFAEMYLPSCQFRRERFYILQPKVEVPRSSETSADLYQSTRRHMPESGTLNIVPSTSVDFTNVCSGEYDDGILSESDAVQFGRQMAVFFLQDTDIKMNMAVAVSYGTPVHYLSAEAHETTMRNFVDLR